jgi:hypothetical protein
MLTLVDPSRQVVAAAALSFERHDIVFQSPRPDQVAVEIKFTNRGDETSPQTMAHLEAAPLGAFVRWRPLAEVLLPEIRPGESHRARFIVPRPNTRPLGRNPGDIPPARLLTALGMEEPPRRPQPVRHLQAAPGTIAFQTRPLPADLFELLGSANPHWAGNLNVFVGDRAIERHLARALRIYPGRANLAFFFVGSGRDAYAFELAGEGANWDAALYHTLARDLGPLMRHLDEIDPVKEREWVQFERQAFLLLAIRPPCGCTSGGIDVHVTQRSTGRTAVVEFSLDPRAAGPGCFVVE